MFETQSSAFFFGLLVGLAWMLLYLNFKAGHWHTPQQLPSDRALQPVPSCKHKKQSSAQPQKASNPTMPTNPALVPGSLDESAFTFAESGDNEDVPGFWVPTDADDFTL